MRAAQYTLPGADGAEDGEIVVFVFPNDVGGLEANVARWVGQVVPAEGVSPDDAVERIDEVVRDMDVTTVHMKGAFSAAMGQGGDGETKEGWAMIATYIDVPGEPTTWTIKATGPEETIERWKPAYRDFVASF